MSNEGSSKREERDYWECAALKALEFVPIGVDGKVCGPINMAERASEIATELVRRRRDAFNDLDIRPSEEDPGERAARVFAEAEARGANPLQALEEAGFEVRKADAPAQGFTADEQRKIEEWHRVPAPLGSMWSYLGSTREQYAAKVEGGKDALAQAAPERQEQSGDVVTRLARHIDPHDPNSAMGIAREAMRFILSDLAPVPCELPDAGAVVVAWGFKGHLCSAEEYAAGMRVSEMLRARIAPVLAAKDAERDELKRMLSATIGMRDTYEAELKATRAAMPANECSNAERAQYEQTIEQQKSRIAELEKRLAERSAPVDATGKTPGQVEYEARMAAEGAACPLPWRERMKRSRDADEASAKAVLRAFGGEALRRARAQIETLDVERFDFEHAKQVPFYACRNVEAIIDDELENLGGQTELPEMLTHCETGKPPWNQCPRCGYINHASHRGQFECARCHLLIEGPPFPEPVG